MSRGRRRFGSVRKLPSGRWQARYLDAAGRRHSAPETFATRTEADRWLALAEADMTRGDWRDPALARVTVTDWADEWLSTCAALKPKTRASYEGMLRAHVLPAFGTAPVSAIDTPEVRRFLAEMTERGSAPATVAKARAVLRLVLATALEAGAIRSNPCVGVRVARGDVRERIFLTPEQVAELADAITNPAIRRGGGEHRRATYPEYGTLVRLAAYSGLRAGELAALRVGRLDLLRRRIDVVESVTEVPREGLVFGTPKNRTRREVPLAAFLVDELAEHVARAGIGRQPDALVFAAPDGGPLRQRNFYRRAFRPAVAATSVPQMVRFHDLRHTCAAMLISGGAPMLAVSRWLGHSSIAVTGDVYGHLFGDVSEAMSDRLDALGRAAIASPGARVTALSEPA